jgi:crossover junction endodeoxyribonuclease RuvC
VNARVLGVDPGTAITGYGVVEAVAGRPGRLLECGVLRTDPRTPLALRLKVLHDGVRDVIARHAPTVVAVEGVFYGRNVRSTVTLSHARAAILLAAAEAGLPVTEYAPAVVKRAVTGTGRAGKRQVGLMVQQLLRLTAAPRPADAADGVALALAHLLSNGRHR